MASEKVLKNVKATQFAGTAIGACSLPKSEYSLSTPVALGSISALEYLKFNSNLCGHILDIDCGNGPLSIIITDSNLGGGLDLYTSSWNKATNNAPAGITKCTVALSNKNPFKSEGMRCFYRTSETNNPWYISVGVFNTGAKLVEKAELNGQIGKKNAFHPFFDFSRKSKKSDTVTFYFNDGSSFKSKLKDCASGKDKQTWS